MPEQPGGFGETSEHLAEPEGAPREMEKHLGQGHGVKGQAGIASN